MTSGSPVILVEGVRKAFGATVALQGADLAVAQGTVQALLGRNGAGKSTLVRILSTLLVPDAGRAWIGGADVVRSAQRVRCLIGLAGQSAAVDPTLTGRENLELVGQLYGLRRREARRRAREVLERLSLTAAADQRVVTYSGGMQRRVDLGASLVGRPVVLIMDEPTTGLDPATRRDLWRLVKELAQDGTTVLLTTQYLEEADQLADQLALIEQGRIIESGTPTELKDRLGQDVLEVRASSGVDVERVRRMLVGLGSGEPAVDMRWHKVTLPTSDPMATLLSASDRILQSGITVEDLGLRRPTLDDVFLTLTANEGAAAANGAGASSPPAGVVVDHAGERISRGRRRRPRLVYPAITAIAVALAAAAVFLVLGRSSSAPVDAATRPPTSGARAPGASPRPQTAAAHAQPVVVHLKQPVASISGVTEGRTIALGATPGGLTADANGNIWVSLPASGTVARVAAATGQVQRFRVGGRPAAIAAAFDRIWVAGSSLGPLASLNIITGQPLSHAQLTATPTALGVADDDQSVCAADATGTLTRLTSTGVVAGTAKLGHPPTGIGCGEGWVWAAEPSPPALVRMSDVGGARNFNGGLSPVAVTFDHGVWLANRDGIVTVFNPHLTQLRVSREITVASELDGIYAVEDDPSVWAFSRQTRTVYRISNTSRPQLTTTVAFSSPPVALVRVGYSVWVATQDGNLTQLQY